MRQLTKLSALSLLLVSGPSFATGNNCLIIMVGGAKEWIKMLPGFDDDISINVGSAAKAEAKRTGCRIISDQNQTPEEFTEMIKKASKPPLFTPGTTVHLSLTDHGSPQDPVNYSHLYLGLGQQMPNADFAKLMKESFPQGTRLTYASSVCWGSLSEMGTFYGLDSHFDYCGSSSTYPTQYSYNRHSVTRNGPGDIKGPYVAVELAHAADRMENGMQAPKVSSLHAWSKAGDTGNLFRMPGLISSTSYARTQLKARKLPIEVDKHPLEALLSYQMPWENIDSIIASFNQARIKDDLADIIQNGEAKCTLESDSQFHEYIKNIGKMYAALMTKVPDNLPEPYKSQATESANWFARNKNRLPELLSNFMKGKLEFWAKNKERALNPAQSAILKEEWEKKAVELKTPLEPFLYQARTLQEGKTVADFLAVAKPEEKARFERFLKCESKPLL